MPDISVVVLGGGGVGKSCLTIQYLQGHFVDQYDATIEDVYRKTISLDNTTAVLTLVDTAGQDAYGAMRDQYLRKGQGFVLVYSITDAESFAHIRRLYSTLQHLREGRSTPCVLVGNKADHEAYRAVSHEKGAQFAAEMNAPFLEITAKDHRMCEQVFEKLVRTVRSGGGASAVVDAAATGASGTANANSAAPRVSGTTAAAAATASAAVNGSAKIKKKRKHRICTLQ
ncbi:putative small GTP-binding protein RAB6 [Leptomonas pyrrhocoris]|uniref:Putative small GTP-binding protein RAB6 n=1 Tax=Leptomonas pyrrhocoris TaxID=157538 RepID=A0A0N0DTA0_LEPPY|nr:putative small GTP-binding protein RAB6 [Leptomonas pyrrhocoris]XP_015655561.1 putative small GTP-binding protein RAB6 [Leptomonas pyrrhocoris]KPA77121.1 putative small GTP-binding protein RAB6 [Leptomonas pyrrhocoris]KPA77122.1 putative small GTP-binding protein RAB6 [Leptomonas pyrrhocoris]|eukprot:XP_015655560.1 putative small GTP-binding protein RAB6 [Leptomonas pyrrhocoris]